MESARLLMVMMSRMGKPIELFLNELRCANSSVTPVVYSIRFSLSSHPAGIFVVGEQNNIRVEICASGWSVSLWLSSFRVRLQLLMWIHPFENHSVQITLQHFPYFILFIYTNCFHTSPVGSPNPILPHPLCAIHSLPLCLEMFLHSVPVCLLSGH